ncbi:MAG: cyclase family protein, partial [Pirellulaceae bacterium]
TWHLYSHAGTHMDAQTHFAAGPETIDQVPLERCLGPAWIADLPRLAPRTVIELHHLGHVAEQCQPGDSLLLRTGWSRYLDQPELYRDALPPVGETLAQWCVDRQVRMLGVEPPSVADVHDLPQLTRIHTILLAGGVLIVEGLVNLEAIAEPRVLFGALPLKLDQGDGCPCRAFAIPWSQSGFTAS